MSDKKGLSHYETFTTLSMSRPLSYIIIYMSDYAAITKIIYNYVTCFQDLHKDVIFFMGVIF